MSLIDSIQSLVQTRLHFQNIIAGFDSEDEATFIDWHESLEPRLSKAGADPRSVRKGKERVASGSAAIDAIKSPAGSPGRVKPRNKAGTNGSAPSSTKKKRRSGV
jgi:hypothetical protein